MRLPKNGKVIILDNEPKEAAPLIQVLTKNKIPHLYYTGDTEQLPIAGDTFDDVRVLFLDINLTNNAVNEATIAQLNNTLRRLIKPGTPYIAAIWSNNQESHLPLVNELFDNRAPDIAPISKILLDKSEFFQYSFEEGYILDPDRPKVLEDIQDKIDECLSQVDAMRLLIEWENSISDALNETILGISDIVDNNTFWNNNLKHIFYKLAHAQLGKTIFSAGNQELQHAALHTLIKSFSDRVEMKISNILIDPELDLMNSGKSYYRKINDAEVKLVWENLTYFLFIDGTQKAQSKNVSQLIARNNPAEEEITSELKSVYSLISPKLNTELLISKSPKINFHPGNVYSRSVTGPKKRKLLKTYFPKIDDKDREGKYKIQDLKVFKFVEVECTPICDYSQSKRLRYRFLSGVLYQNDIDPKLFDSTLDSMYTEIPPFLYNGKVYKLAFDYRLFKSINKVDTLKFTADNFLFRLKSELLIDIQARISSHVNRPGIITIS